MSNSRFPVVRFILFGYVLGTVGTVDAQQGAPVIYDQDRLSPSFHASRRAALLEALPDNAVAVVLSAPERNRENDVSFEYRQSSDLYYLTGTHEPNSVLVMAPQGIPLDGENFDEVLLVPDRNPAREVWTGRLFGAERAQRRLGVSQVVTLDRFEEVMEAALAPGRRLFHLPLPEGVAESSILDDQLNWLRDHVAILDVPSGIGGFVFNAIVGAVTEESFERAKQFTTRFESQLDDPNIEPVVSAFAHSSTVDEWVDWKRSNFDGRYADYGTLRSRLNELRMTKTDSEMALLQRAIDITAAAHREAMRSIEPGMHEFEIEGLVEYVFHRNGAESPGFPSIIGSGENSVILHYETNRRRMENGDVIVMDIGAEYHGYSADVTRTVPVNGRFSEEQRAIYQLVLDAQNAGIEAARAGVTFGAVHQAARQVLADGMIRLGLISSEDDIRRFFMHGTSHYLGLWVHDVGTRGELTPGTVITVEPGIYIAAADDIDPRWWNIGVRIEDDVLITTDTAELLSGGAPREVADIEALMQEQGLGNLPNGVVR